MSTSYKFKPIKMKDFMSQIKQLTLSFPHGASVKDCEAIVQAAQKITTTGVSEGGFATTNHYGMNVDDVTFSEDCMHYVFGHKRSQEPEKCPLCHSSKYSILRDMTSKRKCSICDTSWECPE